MTGRQADSCNLILALHTYRISEDLNSWKIDQQLVECGESQFAIVDGAFIHSAQHLVPFLTVTLNTDTERKTTHGSRVKLSMHRLRQNVRT